MESPTFAGASFGLVGQYERIEGAFTGEVDPKDPSNADTPQPVSSSGWDYTDATLTAVKLTSGDFGGQGAFSIKPNLQVIGNLPNRSQYSTEY